MKVHPNYLADDYWSRKENRMRTLVTQRNLTGLAVVTSLFFVAIATMLVVNSITEGWLDDYGDAAMAITAVASPIAALAGLCLSRRSPVLGGILVVAGAIPMGAIYFWFPPFWVLGLAVAIIGAARARRFARRGLAVA